MRKYLLIILILILDVKTNMCFSQFITISRRGRKIVTPLHSGNHLPLASSLQAVLRTNEQVEDNHPTESLNEINLKSQLFFKSIEMVSLPLSGKMCVTSGFGQRYHPVLHKETLRTGIDLSADYERVYTIANGIIVKEGYDGRAGNYIVIEHGDGIESIYCHLSRFICEPGDLLFEGDCIAFSGSTGDAIAPHLHFAIKGYGEFIDPIPVLKAIVGFNIRKRQFL